MATKKSVWWKCERCGATIFMASGQDADICGPCRAGADPKDANKFRVNVAYRRRNRIFVDALRERIRLRESDNA